MNKEYYNKLVNDEINYLIKKQEKIFNEISEVATTFEYHSADDNISLSKYDIEEINKKRKQILAISELIHNIDRLNNDVVKNEKKYTEYDNECITYIALQIAKSSYYKDSWCYINIYYEIVKELYEDYKKHDNNNKSLLDSINDYLNEHEEEIKEKLEYAFEDIF